MFKEKKINSFLLNFVSPSYMILVVLVFLNPEELSVEKFILVGLMSICTIMILFPSFGWIGNGVYKTSLGASSLASKADG